MEVKGSSQGRQTLSNTIDIKSASTEGVSAKTENSNAYINTSNINSTKNSQLKPVSVADAKKAVDKVNKLLEDKTTHVEYEEDKNFKSVMVMKVVDNNTNEVLREIPSKQIMDLITQFAEMAGLVLDKKV